METAALALPRKGAFVALEDYGFGHKIRSGRSTYTLTTGLFRIRASWSAMSGENAVLTIAMRDSHGAYVDITRSEQAAQFADPRTSGEVARAALAFAHNVDAYWGFGGD
jgi:hypothetical protein